MKPMETLNREVAGLFAAKEAGRRSTVSLRSFDISRRTTPLPLIGSRSRSSAKSRASLPFLIPGGSSRSSPAQEKQYGPKSKTLVRP